MEHLKDIINSIKKHTDAEADKNVLNRSIGRSSVNIERQGNRTVWITNTTSQSNYDRYVDGVGRVHGVARPSIHTYTEDGPTVCKNTAWGRILMENHSGKHSFNVPAGRINAEIYNSSYYTQSQSSRKVYDLKVGVSGNARMLRFPTLADAVNTYLNLLHERENAEILLEKKRKELEEQKKKEEAAKIAAQKERDEAERRKKEEELRIAEEERKRTEAEIEAHNKENEEREKLAKEYEETYNFIRMQATLRLNPRLDISQNNIKFSHLLDGVTSIIEGGPGTGKSTTLIQRMKLLIDKDDLEDQKLNNPDFKLTDLKIRIASERNSWVFFSPTDLLCKYLKADMAYEGLTQYEDKTHVWNDFLRKALMRDDYKLAGAKCRFVYNKKYGEEGLFIGDQLEVVRAFSAYYLNQIKSRIQTIANIDYSKYSWKGVGTMITDRCKGIENANDLPSILKILFALNTLKDLPTPQKILSVKDIVSTYETKVNALTDKYLIEWKKDKDFYNDLIDCEEEILDNDDAVDTVIDIDEDDSIDDKADIAIELKKDIKRFIRLIASSNNENIEVSSIYKDLFDLIRSNIRREDIAEIKDIAYFNREVYPCISNVEVFLLNVDFISNTYLSFRKKMYEEKNPNWDLALMEKIIGVSSKNYIHHDECCLLIGFINNLLIRIARYSGERFDQFKGRFANAYKQNRKAVIGVDEATDYSLIDYYAINSLRHHVVSAVTLSGDMMQSMNAFGIKDWNSLQDPLLFEKIDIQHLRTSYRQGPKLIKLAHYLYTKNTGKRAPYGCYLKDEKKTPDPLWYESDNIDDKVSWMAKRILEVQSAYKKVPSIAIFVNTTQEAQDLYNALKSEEMLEEAGIDVINCTANDELVAPDSVRIFLLERVKGMEFEVVFFYNIDEVSKNKLIDQYIYVGLSRATFYMAVASNEINDPQLKELSERFNKNGKWRNRNR
jgi:hypothetical protein